TMSGKPTPPKMAPKPGIVKVYKALWAYSAQQDDELSFEEGDRLYITDQSETGWWKATLRGKAGLVPVNYVAEDIADSIDFPLHEAAKRGNVSFLTECLDNKVALNGIDKSGSTALHWAARGGHGECVELLTDNALLHLNIQNKLGETPLHGAAWKSHAQIVEFLLEKGADPNIKNNDKKLPYDLAGDAETAALLKPKPVNVTSNDYEDYLGDSD
uniref:Osteoclast-stimulating factor 1 n=1 Tax=Ciona savignyi TaxID=51511 RepID=H2YH20_CIOSA